MNQNLMDKIEKAFDGVPKPENITMRVARAIDDYISSDKYEELRKEDNESRWQDISDKDVEFYDDILTFLNPVGLRYYLPRYMIWALRNYLASDLMIPDYIIFRLNNATSEDWDILNKDQKSVCIEFLEFCANDKTERLDTDLATYCISLLKIR